MRILTNEYLLSDARGKEKKIENPKLIENEELFNESHSQVSSQSITRGRKM